MTPSLIITRPAVQGQAFAQVVSAQWDGPLDVILSPMLKIVFLPVDDDLGAVTDVIFTSANGVAAAAQCQLSHVKRAWCVGSKTAALASDAGFDAITGPGDATGLADLIIQRAPRGIFAHIRGAHTRGDLCARLSNASIACRDIVAYDQIALALTHEARTVLSGDAPVILPLFSPRTARLVADQGPFQAPVHVIGMSKAVDEAADPIGARSVTIASQPTENAMIETTSKLLRHLTHGRD